MSMQGTETTLQLRTMIQKKKSVKGDISMQVIVMAILALVVVTVLIFIFSGKLFTASDDFSACSGKGGSCMKESDCNTKGGLKLAYIQCGRADGLDEKNPDNLICCLQENEKFK